MDDITQHLIDLSDRLDKQNKIVCADSVDKLVNTGALQKVAQYVGAIGYVLKQNRAMANCIRKKRVASNTSMQEVVMDCLKEYQDGQNYHDTEWTSKYAQVITDSPDQFGEAHFHFLRSLSESNNISEDISNVRTVMDVLNKNGEEDELVSKIMSHVDILENMLEKEGSSLYPFKFAAPESQRKWWQRLFSPSEKHWWAPQKWTERGEEADASLEMGKALEQIMSIVRQSQEIRNNVDQLQNQSTSPSQYDLSEQINQLDSSNWNNIAYITNKLRSDIRNTLQNMQLFDDYMNNVYYMVSKIMKSVDKIQADISSLQENMANLRQRAPILGREEGLTEQPNQRAIASPSQEFGVLDRVLNKLYANPLDEESQWYAQRAHSKLHDRLRFVGQGDDELTDNWLGREQQTIPDAASSEVTSPVETTAPTETVNPDDPRIQNAVESLSNKYDPKQVAEILSTIIVDSGIDFNMPSQQNLEILKLIRDMLVQKQAIPHSGSPIGTQSLTAPSPTTDIPSPRPAETQPLTPPSSSIPHSGSPIETQPLTAPVPKTRKKNGPSFWGNIAKEFDEQQRRKHMSTSHMLVKIANELDKVDEDLGDIVDKFMEEHEDDLSKLPDFPEFGVLVTKSE